MRERGMIFLLDSIEFHEASENFMGQTTIFSNFVHKRGVRMNK